MGPAGNCNAGVGRTCHFAQSGDGRADHGHLPRILSLTPFRSVDDGLDRTPRERGRSAPASETVRIWDEAPGQVREALSVVTGARISPVARSCASIGPSVSPATSRDLGESRSYKHRARAGNVITEVVKRVTGAASPGPFLALASSAVATAEALLREHVRCAGSLFEPKCEGASSLGPQLHAREVAGSIPAAPIA
jgi:hypothetical protein